MTTIECRDRVDYATRNQAVAACKRLGGGKAYRCLDCMSWHRRQILPDAVQELIGVVKEAEQVFMDKQMYQEAAGLRKYRMRAEASYCVKEQHER